MRNVKSLLEHIEKFKDTVFILGPEINKYKSNYSQEEYNNIYTRKNIIRKPEEAINFYLDKIMTKENDSDIYNKILSFPHSLIVDLNTNSPINKDIISLHGNINNYYCVKCKKNYTKDEFNSLKDNKYKCVECNGQVRPSIIVSGENYNQLLFNQLKEAIDKTHVLFLIGMDYSEQPILNLIADFGDKKAMYNAKAIDEEEKYLVVIQEDKEDFFDLNSITFCEYLVKDKNIEDAIDRLINSKGLLDKND